MTRFSKFYITAMIAVWIGYGLYSMVTHKPDSMSTLLFGTGFSIVFFIAVLFSEWLRKNYKRIDTVSKDRVSKNEKHGGPVYK